MENQKPSAPKIFFSYSRVDGEQHALRLASDLRNAGADIWIDQLDIELGKIWDLEVEKALNAANCVLFIATEKSTTSNNVLNEVYYALEENKKVIPAVFHDCRIPFRIKRLQRIDFTKDYTTAFQRLLKALDLQPAGVSFSRSTETAMVQSKTKESVAEAAVNEEAENESVLWNNTLRENNPALFAQYLRLYPDGKHREEAFKRMKDLQGKESASAQDKKEPVAMSGRSNFPVQINEPETVPLEKTTKRKGRTVFLICSAGLIAAVLFFLFLNSNQQSKSSESIGKQDAINSPATNTMEESADTSAISSSVPKTGETNKNGIDGHNSNKVPPTAGENTKEKAQTYDDYLRSGINKLSLKEYRSALVNFENAMRLKPKEWLPHYYTGQAYGYLGQLPKAISNFDQALALNSSADMAFLGRGKAKLARRDLTGACADFVAAAKLGNMEAKNNHRKHCGQDQNGGTAVIPLPEIIAHIGVKASIQMVDKLNNRNVYIYSLTGDPKYLDLIEEVRYRPNDEAAGKITNKKYFLTKSRVSNFSIRFSQLTGTKTVYVTLLLKDGRKSNPSLKTVQFN